MVLEWYPWAWRLSHPYRQFNFKINSKMCTAGRLKKQIFISKKKRPSDQPNICRNEATTVACVSSSQASEAIVLPSIVAQRSHREFSLGPDIFSLSCRSNINSTASDISFCHHQFPFHHRISCINHRKASNLLLSEADLPEDRTVRV